MKNITRILDNPAPALRILECFGFVPSVKNRRMVYQPLQAKYLQPKTILNIYGSNFTQNISSKLFDLAWNQLLSKKIPSKGFRHNLDSFHYDNYNGNRKVGVFIYQPLKMTNMTLGKTIVPLLNELLQLPNHQHCYRYRNGGKVIWILNNNGTSYENIDWKNMDWTELIDNLNSHTFCVILDCIECCIANNQLTFLKKVIYFINKMDIESNKWPLYLDEFVIMYVKKYKKLLCSHRYFIDQIFKICDKQQMECQKNDIMKDRAFLYDTKVDTFVNNEIIPKLKCQLSKKAMETNRNLLKQQRQWRCFLCKNVNKIGEKVCPYCDKNELFHNIKIGGSYKHFKFDAMVSSLNPYQAFIENESTMFNSNISDKWFGVLEQKRMMNLTTGESFIIDFKYQTENKTVISVIYHVKHCKQFNILFDIKNSLTIGELKIILHELRSKLIGCGKYRQLLHVSLEKHDIFGKMMDGDIIPQSKDCKPYLITDNDIQFDHRIRDKYKTVFGRTHCNFQCPFMIVAKSNLNSKSNSKSKNVKLDPFKHCPYFSDKFDNDDDDGDKVLDHLTSYDHFQSFDVIQYDCNLKDECPKYQRILKIVNQINVDQTLISNKQSIFKDKKHLYLYCHPVLKKNKNSFAFKRRDDSNSDNADNYNRKIKWYDYIAQPSLVKEMQLQRTLTYTNVPYDRLYDPQGMLMVVRLIREVVTNNYKEDLLPKKNVNSMFDDKKYILNKLDLLKNEWLMTLRRIIYTVDKNTLIKTMKKIETKFNNFYSNTFAIFQTLKLKMNHSRHKKMGCPLPISEMLALVLYCNGKCNYDLSLSQRDGSYSKKWPMFDCLLNYAIARLSQFEEHWENIYSGICNVFYQFKDDNKYLRQIIYFTTNVSFTTDLQKAKEFRGRSGMIIGLNIKRSFAAIQGKFNACDVSWISKYNEKEILVQRGSAIRIYQNKMTQTQTKDGEKQQWFVCDEGNLQETSFQSMFC